MSTSERNDPLLIESTLCAGDPLARALAQLMPLPANIASGPIQFAAGQAAQNRVNGFWRRAFFAQSSMMVLMVGFGGFYLSGVLDANTSPQIVQQTLTTPTLSKPVELPKTPVKPVAEPKSVQPITPPGTAWVAMNYQPTEDIIDPIEQRKWLQLRADIFAAGLSVLPTPTQSIISVDPNVGPPSFPALRGVFAYPYFNRSKVEPPTIHDPVEELP